MSGIGQRIKDARRRAGMTQEALGRRCGVSRAAIAQWENGTTQPSLAHLQRASDALGVWVSWITGEGESEGVGPTRDQALPPRGRTVPVIDYVQAGNWGTVTDPYPPGRGMDMIVTEQSVSAETFALLVRGTSMETGFSEGDKIVVDPSVTPQPGDFVIAKLDGQEEATFKKYRPRGTDGDGRPLIDLVPLNEDWPVLRIDAASPGRVIGTVIEHRRYYHKR